MSAFDDEGNPKPAKAYEIGQDLALLSVEELNDCIAMLRAEITRLEEDLKSKGSTKAAAEALFR